MNTGRVTDSPVTSAPVERSSLGWRRLSHPEAVARMRAARWGGRTVAERIAATSDRSGGPDACWPWTGQRGRKGYGRLSIGGRQQTATRVVYELAHGPIPAGMLVCHTCDNPPCVNAAHLFLGSTSDNGQDAASKGRIHRPIGSLNGNARLTEDDVRAIRALVASGTPKATVAEHYGMSPLTIRDIAGRQTWRHVTDEVAS